MSARKSLPPISPRARQLINAFAARVEDYAFLGAAHPDDHAAIERGKARAERALYDYIYRLEQRKPTVQEFTKEE